MAGADRFRERAGDAPGRGASVSVASVPFGERVAAVSGGALIVLMLLDWFGGRNAWQLKFVDFLLLAIAILALGLAVSRAVGQGGPAGTGLSGLVLTIAGGVAVGMMLTLVLESSGGTVPLVLSLLATVGILGGGLLAMRDASASGVPRVMGPSSSASGSREAGRSGSPHGERHPSGRPTPPRRP